MSVCPSCGFRNAGSDPFCRNPACGAFLGWGDEGVTQRRPPLRIDPAGAGAAEVEEAPADDTQPFDAEAEARRPDSPAERRAPGPEAGPGGVRSALGTSEPPAPRPPAPDAPAPDAPAPDAPAPGGPARPAGTDSGHAPPEPGRTPTPEPGGPAPPPPAAGPGRPNGASGTSWFERGDSGSWGPLPPAPARQAGPPERDPGLEGPPPAPPPPDREAAPWRAREQEPPRQPEWRTALGRGGRPTPGEGLTPPPPPRQAPGGEPPRPAEPPRPVEPPRGAEGPRGETPGGGTTVSREAIRAAIRGEAPTPAGIPGPRDPRDPVDSRRARDPRDPGGQRGDRLVLPATTDGAPPARRRRDSFPSESELLKRPPVWERMLRRLPVAVPGEGSLRKAPSARDRERQRALLRLVALVAVIVLVGGVLWFASTRGGSSTGAGGTAAATRAPTLVQVRPAGVVASTQSGSRIAGNVVDGKLKTFWSRLVPSGDDQPFLRFSFNRPVELGRLAIAAGASGTEFGKRPRPQEVELRFSDGTTLRTTLADRPSFQTVNFKPRTVDGVRLVILSTYPSSGPQRTSISEIRFYAVKG
jgi:hypothetical protein